MTGQEIIFQGYLHLCTEAVKAVCDTDYQPDLDASGQRYYRGLPGIISCSMMRISSAEGICSVMSP